MQDAGDGVLFILVYILVCLSLASHLSSSKQHQQCFGFYLLPTLPQLSPKRSSRNFAIRLVRSKQVCYGLMVVAVVDM